MRKIHYGESDELHPGLDAESESSGHTQRRHQQCTASVPLPDDWEETLEDHPQKNTAIKTTRREGATHG